ncbi:hypothetical protein [Hoeflea olei]|uniref:DUF3828 domain-containing protein n=1 Tax=Hoeflea olei TaxID=1480615 RepID=A0A1C1YUQ6_9HYPH|nr:hypothetical protein [Hoeflea olei]OCW57126.1 hypothetical protein AWJ14_08280 [Hoeflea olei]
MRKTFPILTLLASIAAGPAVAGEPAEAVRYFYENIGAEVDVASRDRFTSPALDFLNAADAAWDRDETVCIDFGFAVDAQDFDEDEIATTLKLDETVEGDTARVSARFENFGQPTQVDWTLRKGATGWLVADIAAPDKSWSVSTMECQ